MTEQVDYSEVLGRTCEPCRKRKIRCDKKVPCSHCIKRNIVCCTQLRSRGRPKKIQSSESQSNQVMPEDINDV